MKLINRLQHHGDSNTKGNTVDNEEEANGDDVEEN